MATPSAEEVRDRAFTMMNQAQEAGLKVAENWASMLTGGARDGQALVPTTPEEIVDRFYDTGVQVLEAQRSMAHSVLGAVAPALRAVTVVMPSAPSGR